MKNQKIIISDPPGSGKTTIIHGLKGKGYNCLKEINPTDVKDVNIKNNKNLLSDFLFTIREKQYHQFENQLAFYDRSMIDVVAYLNYWKIQYPKDWNQIIQNCQYSNNVFYTPSWKDIYTQSTERLETYEESKLIDNVLKTTYLDFGYNIIEIPKSDIKTRLNFIIKNI